MTVTGTTLSQGSRIAARDHGGNAVPAGSATILGKCPECLTAFQKPANPYAADALKCGACGHDFLLALIARQSG